MKLLSPLALVFALCLSGCDAFDTVREGYAHSQAVSTRLEKAVGVKSFVGFNWNNGTLTSVSVTFERVPADVQLPAIVKLATEAVAAEFKQKPKQVVIGFAVQP
ncbi:hypothetical protein LZ009_16980 [Ramlibacter sp. XY19]|uniref:hypothetical protein n=1 Tax=Ramlibacter paludis TaxID=2908000 RepID=UPI0023DBA780|nr:hypothetical protein [Ramlibacter paludis]MCG2594474.1 hypothetical protein [Ramlibacter paludis]